MVTIISAVVIFAMMTLVLSVTQETLRQVKGLKRDLKYYPHTRGNVEVFPIKWDDYYKKNEKK